ncbi:helix-turn-helix domain-containing protein [Actinomadura geliboluensis]|uniref:helix-turn-helix domain-containing protein n=1 Tax=Actinomadura geliboluensis TaxID=882440 RepID=UPI0014872CE2
MGREVVVVGHDSVQRRIAPACAQPGATHTHVAAELGVSPPTVATWRRRFIEHGPAGLTDEPRPGRYAGHRQVTAGAADDAGHARTAHPRLQSAPAPAGTARAPGFPVCLCWEPVRGRLKRAGILVSEAAHNYRGRPHA